MTKHTGKRLTALLLTFIMAFSIIAPVTVMGDEGDAPPERPVFDYRFDLVYENEYAQLLLDRRNNTIRVVNLATGVYFNTLAMEGQQGNPVIQNHQRSDFAIDIIRDATTGVTHRMDSFSESVQRRQVEYTDIDGGIRAHFTLGDPDALHLTMFPRYISEERMNTLIFEHLDFDGQSFVMNHWVLLDGRYTRAHLTFDPTTGEPTTLSIPVMRRLWTFFYEYGNYSFEELDYDNTYWDYLPFEPPMMVSLAIEYTLCGPDLLITVPREHMDFIETQPFRAITLHPYLMSGSIHDEGYLFVPDGSGGIIMFNNGMTAEDVNIPVFGRDLLNEGWNVFEFFEQATLPVFGMIRNDMGILAVIEEGAPVATIHANTSGRIDEYNRIFASFELSFFEGLLMRGVGAGATTVQHMDVYDMDIRVRYILLTGDNANYVGMARAYQNYLLDRDLLRINEMHAYAPFFVNFYASAPRQRMRLGIPTTHHFPMTSTEDAQNILQSLTDQGVRNIHAQYSHWTNSGMLTTHLGNVTPLRSIGGRRGITELAEFSESIDVNLYPAARATTFMMAPRGFLGRFGRVNGNMLTRGIGNWAATVSWRTMADRSFGGGSFMLSPNYWLGYITRFIGLFSNIGISNVSLIDIGGILFGNYGRRIEVTRMEAVDYAIASLEAVSDEMGLMLTNPNAYAFAFATAIVDLPFRSGGRRIVDYTIPFVQLVLENHIPFAMPAYNESPMSWRGFQEYMLRAVESRSAMQLILTYQHEEEFFPTFQQFWVMNTLPSMTMYSRWEDSIGYYYAQFNAFYQQVRGAYTVSREIHNSGDGVVVNYSNGVTVYINYSDNPWEINGRVIAPLSFEVIS